ncbi:unnamed protein product [Owenia fusiformis]|uniref:Multifunctional methyltransferase subunit TRM112-like protein n=1 Tax=Owenia fusiformis TaxID=6347 RepID=A0A8J1T6H3_OWEFU|nr:unnamed protein product [Owenia fusiformis]
MFFTKLLKMNLFTHNMLTSNIIKGVTKGYPLGIEATEVKTSEREFNPDFIGRMIPRLEWPAVVEGAKMLGQDAVPEEVPSDYETNEEFLKQAHRLLLEVTVQEGNLICPESGRKFPITNGIANMLLKEDET